MAVRRRTLLPVIAGLLVIAGSTTLGLVLSSSPSPEPSLELAACELAASVVHPQPSPYALTYISIEPIRKVENSRDPAIAESAREWIAVLTNRYPPGGQTQAAEAMLSACHRARV